MAGPAEEIINLLVEGINESETKGYPCDYVPDEREAIMHAYKNASRDH